MINADMVCTTKWTAKVTCITQTNCETQARIPTFCTETKSPRFAKGSKGLSGELELTLRMTRTAQHTVIRILNEVYKHKVHYILSEGNSNGCSYVDMFFVCNQCTFRLIMQNKTFARKSEKNFSYLHWQLL
jgi:hypothetical protein